MIRGLYTSGIGMITQMNRMDVVANNMANVDTTGYKKDMAVTRSFSDELMKRLDDPADLVHASKVGNVNLGVFVDDIFTDHRNGSLRQTNGPLDIAISGEGFFAIQVTNRNGETSTKYTRDGSFTMAPDGTLMTKEGNLVLGENDGPIVIPHGVITVTEEGVVYSGNIEAGRLKLVDFEDKHTLRKTGDNLYDITENSVEKPFAGAAISNYLENSNVNSVKGMVDMITVNRIYEANQRLVTIHDTILGRAVTDIATRR